MKKIYNVRDNRGRYTHKKKSFAKKVLITVISIWAVLATYALITSESSETIVVNEPVVETVTKTINERPGTIQEMKDAVLDDLAYCESRTSNHINWDDYGEGKNRASFGMYQFKVGTVQHYWKILEGEEITDADAVLLALDTERAREFAERIIFDIQGGIFNWENCSKQHNLVGKVELIKKLMASE